MKIEKLEENKNLLLERKEINTVVSFEGPTPKREMVKKEICSKVGANPDMSLISKLETGYGSNKLKVRLHVYDSAEKMKKNEPYHLLVRDKFAEKKPKKEKVKKEKPK